ncbi:hypothetical protein [Bacteroides cellulosilyticus]|jgi:conserved domain protein|uniref:hypothetical protein n=1 Tax=Bacteroides cellulosilyticus TaxID=246787 RepID=UPI00189CD8A2|nr:hypothetical protein [Bacteroides cellulosilyticus]DAU03795.1 MAG TPA: hypothetical protein [Caudoviricetes sp.]
MTILQQPDALSLSQNLKEFHISSDVQVSFILKQGGVEILSQRYDPSADGHITINLRDIVHARLSYQLIESGQVYEQSSLASDFTAMINDTTLTFRVIRSGIDRLADSAANFLTQNFLTWQPSIKPVTYYSPEFLTYYATIPCVAKLRAYFTDTSGSVISQTDYTVAEMVAGIAYTIPLQYSVVAGWLGHKLPAYYDIWVENLTGQRLTYIQRYYAEDMRTEQEQWILFENSLGGLDTFRAYGTTTFSGEHTHNLAEIDEISQEYRVDTERKFQKNTGHLNQDERKWLLDFFPSQAKYLYAGNYLRQIVVTESNVSYTDRALPSNYTFTFKYADARPLLNLPRTDIPADVLSITVPEVGSFTVPPRLAEFPRLPLSEGALFPIQNPYSEEWGITTAEAFATFVGQQLAEFAGSGGGIGHQHRNIDLLNLLSYVAEYLLVNNKKIKAGYSDIAGDIEGDKYIHKDRVDRTDYLLQFGEFIDSLIAGKGGGIYPDGRAQFNSLEIRDSLTVLRLIINEIHAMAGDFSFSDCGAIEKVELLDDGTYQLTMEKRTDTDWTTLEENDVLCSIVNSLLIGGTDYYTSWFRPVSKNRNDNTLTVVLYPDSEVPGGKNYPPVEGYNVTRKGNAKVPDAGEAPNERAQSWLISSREGRIMFLQNVFRPILEDYNYALTLGRFPNVKMIEKLPIGSTDVGVMSKIGVFEKIYEADWNGTIIPKKVDRGEWSLATAQGDEPYRFVDYETLLENQKVITTLEQHTVYHYGCKWGCLIDKTIDEPKWNSAGWVLLEGDKNYYLDFIAPGTAKRGQVNMDITAWIKYANRDITNVLLATTGVSVEWLRDTGNIPADNSWKPVYVDGQKNVIHIDNTDEHGVGLGFGYDYQRVKFICRVFIPMGEDMETVENYVGFRI